MADGSADTVPISEAAAHWRKEPEMNSPKPVVLCVIWFGGSVVYIWFGVW